MKNEILNVFKESGFDEYNCPYFKEEEITDIINKLDTLFVKRIVGVTFKEKHTKEFQEFVKKEVNTRKVGNIYWYKGVGYLSLDDLFKMYKKIKVKP